MFALSRAAVLLAFCLLVTEPARAAIQLEPGTWQETATGSENGEPVKPEVTTNCITPQDTRDPVKALSALKDLATLVGQRCKTLQVREKGNTVAVEFECGEPKTLLIAITMTFNFLDARRYTGTVKSRFAFKGRETSADKTIEAKWSAAECEKQ